MKNIKFWGLLAAFLLAGCGTQSAVPQTAAPVTLIPYSTRTPLSIPSATAPVPVSPVPSPTPFIYSIARGDTLNALAQRFGISVDDLLSANPGLVAEALTIGQKLNIPPAGQVFEPAALTTPVPPEIGAARCLDSDGGVLCLVLVRNPYPQALENVKVELTLLDKTGQSVASQEALLPLNILEAGQSLPASALFAGYSGYSDVQVRLLTGALLPADDVRYLKADVHNVLVKIAWDGLSASLQGQISLPQDSKPANRVWLAAVAYDAAGQVAGYRRWEASDALQPGGVLDFVLNVYSLGSQIERVDVQLEAARGDLAK